MCPSSWPSQVKQNGLIRGSSPGPVGDVDAHHSRQCRIGEGLDRAVGGGRQLPAAHGRHQRVEFAGDRGRVPAERTEQGGDDATGECEMVVAVGEPDRLVPHAPTGQRTGVLQPRRDVGRLQANAVAVKLGVVRHDHPQPLVPRHDEQSASRSLAQRQAHLAASQRRGDEVVGKHTAGPVRRPRERDAPVAEGKSQPAINVGPQGDFSAPVRVDTQEQGQQRIAQTVRGLGIGRRSDIRDARFSDPPMPVGQRRREEPSRDAALRRKPDRREIAARTLSPMTPHSEHWRPRW